MKQFLVTVRAYAPHPKEVSVKIMASSYSVASARGVRFAMKTPALKRKRFDPTQGMTVRVIPAGTAI